MYLVQLQYRLFNETHKALRVRVRTERDIKRSPHGCARRPAVWNGNAFSLCRLYYSNRFACLLDYLDHSSLIVTESITKKKTKRLYNHSDNNEVGGANEKLT